ncbi:hypothetical protein CDIK_1672 [Cucumispora dikerogammari]|nr:hypothetical protein CDIK_1672 [Cucumispora dikerogammari]
MPERILNPQSRTEPSPASQPRPQPNNNSEAINQSLNKFILICGKVMGCAVILFLMYGIGYLSIILQARALVKHHNFIPNGFQEALKLKDDTSFWKSELEYIQLGCFFSSNEFYRFFVDENGDVYGDNSTVPLGRIFFPVISAGSTSSKKDGESTDTNNLQEKVEKKVDTQKKVEKKDDTQKKVEKKDDTQKKVEKKVEKKDDTQKKGVEKKQLSQYTLYINSLLSKKKAFIVEFRKQTKSLIFYTNQSALVITNIFLLNLEPEQMDIFLLVKNYEKTKYTNFLTNLDPYIDINDYLVHNNKQKGPSNKKKASYEEELKIFKYLLFNGAFNLYNLTISRNYISLLSARVQLLLPGNFTDFLDEILCGQVKSFYKKGDFQLIVRSVSIERIEFLIVYLEDLACEPHVCEFERDEAQIFYLKVQMFFNCGDQKEAADVWSQIKSRSFSYEAKWRSILLDKNSIKKEELYKRLVKSYYNVETGWDNFKKLSCLEQIKIDKKTPKLKNLVKVNFN